MKILTVGNIVEACNGKLVNGEEFKEKEIAGAAIDSRKVEKDFLFFAFKGEKVDGHDYIQAAFNNGAAAVVCERVPEGEEGICIVVEDTIAALKKIATYYREQLPIKVVGVTGSVGKTTTKEFIATVLSQKYNVFRTSKNQNNLIGLPLSILNIGENNDVAVLEMGISEFGEMRQLSEMAKPDVCVITNISTCHLETLGSLDGVFKAKTEIFEHMNPEGFVCVCGDDERLAKIEDVNGKKPVTFGLEETNEVHPTKILNRGLWGSECTVENGDGIFDISVPLAGKHMILDALAAVSVAKVMDLSAEQVSFGISLVKTLQGRNNLIQKNGITIIDDCYNASPESMRSALDLLTEAITPTVAILGDMFEQGENEDKCHEEIGEYAVSKNINTIVCVGELSKKMYDKAMSGASVKENMEVLYFKTVDEAIENLTSFIKKDDTVLLKASNGMNFSRILDALTKEETEFEKREEKLFKKPNIVNANLDELMSEIKNVGTKKEDNNAAQAAATSTAATAATTAAVTDNAKKTKVKSSDQKEKEGARNQLFVIIGIIAAVLIIAAAVFGIVKHNEYKKATQGEILYLSGVNYYTKGLIEDSVIASSAVDDNGENMPFTFDGKNYYYGEGFGSNFTLHYVGKTGKNDKTVESEVAGYDILKKNKILYFSKNNLYIFTPGKDETNLLAEGVAEYHLNDKKDTVLYRNFEGNLCSVKINKPDSVSVYDSEVTKIEYADEALKNVVYYKNDGFYYSKAGKKNVKITDNAAHVYVPEKEKSFKLYFIDNNSSLWYFASKSSKAKKVLDSYSSLSGTDYGYASLMVMTSEGDFKFIRDSKVYTLKDFTVGQTMQAAGSEGKKMYFMSRDAASGQTNLYSIKFTLIPGAKKCTVESTNVEEVEYIGEGNVLVCKNDGSGKLDLYSKETLVARNIERDSVEKCEYGKDFVFAYQVSDDEGFYKIVRYNGNNIEEIGSSIDKEVCAISKKKIIYRTKSSASAGFDIKVYNGKKSKVYKEGVDDYKFMKY